VITLFAYLGSFMGDQSSYLMGRIFGTKVLNWNFIKKRSDRVEQTKKLFKKYEFRAILLGRMTPSIRPFAPFLVGSFRLDYKKFLLYDLLACSIWGLGLVLLVVLWEYVANFF
jgi:membrane-associated protein|tara:strand:- start:16109 stop:16447 length:339 start_codon:yes stop_codon:yes gene_type:complete